MKKKEIRKAFRTMTYYLRNEKNNSVVDIELWVKKDEDYSYVEISCSIDIRQYSLMLLKAFKEGNGTYWQKMIQDFDELSEIRSWMWEDYFSSKKNTPEEMDNVASLLREKLKYLADTYSLYLVTD
jgi:hypothetical protein